ncbi:hypothetical protein DICA1_D18712 [Diutina catenulata]
MQEFLKLKWWGGPNSNSTNSIMHDTNSPAVVPSPRADEHPPSETSSTYSNAIMSSEEVMANLVPILVQGHTEAKKNKDTAQQWFTVNRHLLNQAIAEGKGREFVTVTSEVWSDVIGIRNVNQSTEHDKVYNNIMDEVLYELSVGRWLKKVRHHKVDNWSFETEEGYRDLIETLTDLLDRGSEELDYGHFSLILSELFGTTSYLNPSAEALLLGIQTGMKDADQLYDRKSPRSRSSEVAKSLFANYLKRIQYEFREALDMIREQAKNNPQRKQQTLEAPAEVIKAPVPKSVRNRYYAVARGRTRGVFHSQLTCYLMVKDYPGALNRSFDNPVEAHAFLEETEPTVYKGDSDMPPHVRVVDEIYVEGACREQGTDQPPLAGIGVFFGSGDKRNISKSLNFVEEIESDQPGDRAALLAFRAAMGVIIDSIVRGVCDGPARIHIDSHYVAKSLTEWWPEWEKNDFRKNGKMIPNYDLIKGMVKELREINEFYVTRGWQKLGIMQISGRGDLEGNIQANMLATQGADKRSKTKMLEVFRTTSTSPSSVFSSGRRSAGSRSPRSFECRAVG